MEFLHCSTYLDVGGAYLPANTIFILLSGRQLLHPQHSPHHPEPSFSPPAKRPKTDILPPQEHTLQASDFKHNRQTPGMQLSALVTYTAYLKSVYTWENKVQVYY